MLTFIFEKSLNYHNIISIKYNGITRITNEDSIKYLLEQDYGTLVNTKKKGNNLYIEFTKVIIVILNIRNIKRYFSNSYISYYIDNLDTKILKR